jgi:hypothetical protein
MTARYEVDADNAVWVFHVGSDVASLFQPHWPNGDAWADAAEALAWAQLRVASIEDEDAPYAPNARGEAGKAKPTAEQRAAIVTAHAAVEAATTPEERQTAQAALEALYTSM